MESSAQPSQTLPKVRATRFPSPTLLAPGRDPEKTNRPSWEGMFAARRGSQGSAPALPSRGAGQSSRARAGLEPQRWRGAAARLVEHCSVHLLGTACKALATLRSKPQECRWGAKPGQLRRRASRLWRGANTECPKPTPTSTFPANARSPELRGTLSLVVSSRSGLLQWVCVLALGARWWVPAGGARRPSQYHPADRPSISRHLPAPPEHCKDPPGIPWHHPADPRTAQHLLSIPSRHPSIA